MIEHVAEWHRLSQEFYDVPDYHKSLRAYKKDRRWHLMGGASEAHDDARIHYLYTALAERAAAVAETKTGSLDEWLDLIVAQGPPHETWRGGAVPDTIDGIVPQPHILAIERLCTVSSDFCRRLEADAFAQASRSVSEAEPPAKARLTNSARLTEYKVKKAIRTHELVAENLGLERSVYFDLKAGRRVSEETYIKTALAIGCTADDLKG
jgi:hypothetical protein